MGKVLAEFGDEDVQAARGVEVGRFPYGGQEVVALDHQAFLTAEYFKYFCFFGCQRLAFFAVAELMLGGKETVTADGVFFFRGSFFDLRGGCTLFDFQYSLDMGI